MKGGNRLLFIKPSVANKAPKINNGIKFVGFAARRNMWNIANDNPATIIPGITPRNILNDSAITPTTPAVSATGAIHNKVSSVVGVIAAAGCFNIMAKGKAKKPPINPTISNFSNSSWESGFP